MAAVIKYKPSEGHVNCGSCGKYNQPACPTGCNYCKSCCMCQKCKDCRKVHPRTIQKVCKYCYKCKSVGCDCDKLSKVERTILKQLQLQPQNIYRKARGTLTRITSCEIEVSNWHQIRQDTEHGLKIDGAITNFHHDGSVEGDNPLEAAIGPIPPTRFDVTLKGIEQWIKAHRAEVNETCGFHVHVNSQDFDPYQLRRFIRLYDVLEPTFFNLVAESRATAVDKRDHTKMHSRPNSKWEWAALRMCYNLHRPEEIRRSLLAGIYVGKDQMQGREERHVNYSRYRYKALNLHSHYQRGTIEFRHHEGTLDITRIRGWMLWCAWIVELAGQMYDSETYNLTAEGILYGKWQRPWGYLQLPEEVVKYVEGGRAKITPQPQPTLRRLTTDIYAPETLTEEAF